MTTPAVLFGAAFALVVASTLCHKTNEQAVARALVFGGIAIALMACAAAFSNYVAA